jgi:hypothetical protein
MRVLFERPAYQNNGYLPTVEDLHIGQDGTRTIRWYYFSGN